MRMMKTNVLLVFCRRNGIAAERCYTKMGMNT